MTNLIHRLGELSHLTPDQIVNEIADPLAIPVPTLNICNIPLKKILGREFSWVRSDMSRFDSYSVNRPSIMSRHNYQDMCDGDYVGWSIIGFEHRHRTDLGLPPCVRS